MYILYLDESGTHDESGHFVVAGIAVFERQTYCLAQGMERLQLKKSGAQTNRWHGQGFEEIVKPF